MNSKKETNNLSFNQQYQENIIKNKIFSISKINEKDTIKDNNSIDE